MQINDEINERIILRQKKNQMNVAKEKGCVDVFPKSKCHSPY